MKRFHFDTHILKTRKRSWKAILLGLLAISGLVYQTYTYLSTGKIDWLDNFMNTWDLMSYQPWIYGAIFAVLAFFIFPALYTLLKKRIIKTGYITIDEDNLIIKDGRKKYQIPEKDLKRLSFELKSLPSGKRAKKEGELFAGGWMHLPTDSGVHSYELNLNTKEKQDDLKEMVEYLKIQHDVKVSIKSIKK